MIGREPEIALFSDSKKKPQESAIPEEAFEISNRDQANITESESKFTLFIEFCFSTKGFGAFGAPSEELLTMAGDRGRS